MIDVDAARRYLAETLPAVEVVDPYILDAAAAVVIGSRKRESPRSPFRGPSATTTERNSANESYPASATRAI